MTFLSAIPALPVLDIRASTAFYCDHLGMAVRHQETDFSILVKDSVEIHLWAANKPDVSGAEPYLAGSASCRVLVDDIQSLYKHCQEGGIMHGNGGMQRQYWGTDEFTVIDPDNNIVTFYMPVATDSRD